MECFDRKFYIKKISGTPKLCWANQVKFKFWGQLQVKKGVFPRTTDPFPNPYAFPL